MVIDRSAELEKLADKLGIGKNRDVKCAGHGGVFKFKDAIILTNDDETKYLCKDCYKKLLDGKLKELEKFKEVDIQPVPYRPQESQPWVEPNTYPYIGTDYKITYTVQHDPKDTSFIALVPNESFK